MPKLNKRFIDALPAAAAVVVHWDEALKGFGLRQFPSGVRTFVFDYRNADGRKRRVTVGRFGALTVEQARTLAVSLAGRVAKGEDPAAEIAGRRVAPTVSDLCDDYLSKHVDVVNSPRQQQTARAIVEKHIRPALGALKVASVTRQDVQKLHRRLSGTPRTANLALATLSKAFSLAEQWEMRPNNSNPCSRAPRFEENQRERFLSAAELARLGAAMEEAETVGLPWRENAAANAKHRAKLENRRTLVNASAITAIKLLLLTGARSAEILELEWAHVDFDKGTIALPSRKGGGRRAHPVSVIVLQLLAALPRQGSPYVLPAPFDAAKPLSPSVLSHAWQALRWRARIADVRVHDLRHTSGTYVSQTGANAFLVRDFLRHKSIAMTGRYANRDVDPIREAAEAVATRVQAGMAGGTVLPFEPK